MFCVLLILILYGVAAAEEMILPEGLSIIEEEAFCGADSLNRVVLPEGIAEIRGRAFANSSLKEIVFPEEMPVIAPDAFEGCEGWKAIVLAGSRAEECCLENNIAYKYADDPAAYFHAIDNGDGSCSITKYAGKGGYVRISEIIGGCTVNAILEKAFRASEVTYVSLPKTLKRIERYAFFNVKKINAAECWISGYKGDVKGVSIPETIGGRTVTGIAASAFKGKKNIKSISALNSVSTIGNFAFQNCTALTHIQLTDKVTSLKENTHSGCEKLQSIVIVSFQ